MFGGLACGWLWRRDRLEAEVLGFCSVGDEALVCYSVRSGWDLWLRAQGLLAGQEVIVSTVTHPDMVRIIHGHGLCAVPVDIDPETLAPRLRTLEAALTPRTRVVLVGRTSSVGAWTSVLLPDSRESTAYSSSRTAPRPSRGRKQWGIRPLTYSCTVLAP